MGPMLEILYNYKPYPTPKKGLFALPKKEAKYTLSKGWEQEIKELTIIGETKEAYIHKLIDTEQGYWQEDVVIVKKFTLPLGPHKTRLIRWTNGQISLW